MCGFNPQSLARLFAVNSRGPFIIVVIICIHNSVRFRPTSFNRSKLKACGFWIQRIRHMTDFEIVFVPNSRLRIKNGSVFIFYFLIFFEIF